MRVPTLFTVVMVTVAAVAQTSQPLSRANSGAHPVAAVSKACASVVKQYKALRNGTADASFSNLASLQSRGEACLNKALAPLSPDQRSAAEAAFKLYQAANEEIVSQMRQRDFSEARAAFEQEVREGVYRMVSLFAQHSELSYRYDELLEQMQKYVQAEEKFHSGVAGATAPISPPAPFTLPSKVEFLNCSDYHIGRFSVCWPPDDD